MLSFRALFVDGRIVGVGTGVGLDGGSGDACTELLSGGNGEGCLVLVLSLCAFESVVSEEDEDDEDDDNDDDFGGFAVSEIRLFTMSHIDSRCCF